MYPGMRACAQQYVGKDGEILCQGDDKPCSDMKPNWLNEDGTPNDTPADKKLILCCPDRCEPEEGSTWEW